MDLPNSSPTQLMKSATEGRARTLKIVADLTGNGGERKFRRYFYTPDRRDLRTGFRACAK